MKLGGMVRLSDGGGVVFKRLTVIWECCCVQTTPAVTVSTGDWRASQSANTRRRIVEEILPARRSWTMMTRWHLRYDCIVIDSRCATSWHLCWILSEPRTIYMSCRFVLVCYTSTLQY